MDLADNCLKFAMYTTGENELFYLLDIDTKWCLIHSNLQI